ncbi:hypothetical protein [Yinghuangia sp. YIM S09857]|uniref:hypothetical protein n=1 Tax=Yinghuangia sp. YIM S09857 TaxID=3436929 RepID=UPI003F53778D
MSGHGRYAEEFVQAWRELDLIYADLVAAAVWPGEARRWEARRREHEAARKETVPTQAGFEANTDRWRSESLCLAGELEKMRCSTPEQRARSLDPWTALRRTGAQPQDGQKEEYDATPRWPGWRERLWRMALHADVQLPRPLLPGELAEAEEQLAVRLPRDYRWFLLEVAAGIPSGLAAPNLAPLVRDASGVWSWDGIGTRTGLLRLTEEFPAREVDAPPEDEPQRGDFASDERYLAELGRWENEQPPYDRDPVDDLTCGALCLHSLGCGDAVWLVVSGPHAGRMWADHLVVGGGLYALRGRRRSPVFFRDWFLDAYGR